jgi:hypothetical protein
VRAARSLCFVGLAKNGLLLPLSLQPLLLFLG